MKTIKVLAGSLAALTAGATLALGIFATPITSLGDYVRVTATSGTLNSPLIVVGSPATLDPGYPLDVVGAADIAAAVAGYATTPVSSGAVGLGVSGGAEVGTTSTKLYFGDPLSKTGVKTTLTKSDLTTLLASGTLTDAQGTNYNYDQYLGMQTNGAYVTYGNSGGDLSDPDYLLNLSTTAAGPGVINYSVTFNKLLNVSSADVQNKKLNLLGVDYTIGATSDFRGSTYKLVLYGNSLVQTLSGGESKTVNVGGTDYIVKLVGVTSTPGAVVSVNGDTYTINKGSTTTISSLPVYVEDAFYLSSTDQTQNSAKLSFGTNKLTLENGSAVKKGTSDTTIDGTLVSLIGTPNTGLSKIEIAIAAKDSSHDYAQQGADKAFVDPIFGSFKIALGPGGLNGGATEKITVDNSGTTGATLKFTDYRGNEKMLTYAYTSSSTFAPDMNSTSTATYVAVENSTVKKGDYVLLAPSIESEFSHVMQYSTSSSLGSSGAYIELKDAMSDAVSRFYLTNAGSTTGTMYIDGQAYYAALVDTTSTGSMAFTWGASAAVNSPGSKVTVYPLVKTSLGGWVTFVPGKMGAVASFTVPTVGGNTTLELPGGAGSATTIKTEHTGVGDAVLCGTSYNITAANVNATGVLCDDGRLTWNITVKSGATSNATYVNLITGATYGINASYPVVIFKEEKSKDITNTDVQNFVLVPITAGSGTTAAVTVSTPVLTSGTQMSQSLQSDTSVTNYVDRRGTFVKYDTDGQGLVEMTYPDEQAVATVAVGSSPAFGSSGAGTVQAAVKITSPVAKLASEVSQTAPGADLILVGGPCANSLVAKLLAPSVTCDSWNYTTGIIKEVTGGFSDGSRALIIAGTAATDTRALVARAMQGTLSYQA